MKAPEQTGAPPAIDRDELIRYLDRLLAADVVEDVCPNGLQVEGPTRVTRVVTGVSACDALFERARELDADLVLVHHGLFWRGDSGALTGLRYRRVAALIRNDLNLAAYHLPLDRHPELGNNAVAARRLGLEGLEPFGTWRGIAIGVRGIFRRHLSPAELAHRCRDLFGQEPLVFAPDRPVVSRLGIVSGAAADLFHEAIGLGLDAFVTGEPREWVKSVAEESGTLFLACGHHATERLGVQALGERLAERFGLDVRFVDVPNPV